MESEHHRKTLDHLLDASGPSSQTAYHQHTYEGPYSMHPQQQQSRQSRQSCTPFGFTALASLLAILYIVRLCAFRKAGDAPPLPVRRKLAEGRGAEQSGGSSADSDEACGYVSSHSDASPARSSASSSPPPAITGSPEPLEEGPPQKKRKKMFSGKRGEKKQYVSSSAASPLVPLDPQLEAYIVEALQGGNEFRLAEWLLDPQLDLPVDSVLEEEDTPLSPGEGTSSSSKTLLHLATVLHPEEPRELPFSPGEGMRAESRKLLQAAREPQTEQTSSGDSGVRYTPTAEAAPPTGSPTPGLATAPATPGNQEGGLEQHPFYRHATVPSHVSSKEILWEQAEASSHCVPRLNAIRELLKRKALTQEEVNRLAYQASLLLSYARHTMTKDISQMRLYEAATAAMNMVMVLDALYVSAAALGPHSKVETWWNLLMDTIPQNKVAERRHPGRKAREKYRVLEEALDILEVFRTGRRPPANVLVPLKRWVICSSPTPLPRFRDPVWDPWREDDKAWGNQADLCLWGTEAARGRN